MRKILVNTFLSLDGVMQAPGGPEEDPAGGFTPGGWSVNYWDDAMGQLMGEVMGKPFDLLLGRKTYEIFAAHWPHSDEPGADALNNATQVRGVDDPQVCRVEKFNPDSRQRARGNRATQGAGRA